MIGRRPPLPVTAGRNPANDLFVCSYPPTEDASPAKFGGAFFYMKADLSGRRPKDRVLFRQTLL